MQLPYPFVLVNARKFSLSYIEKYKEFIERVLIDSGVEIFRDSNVKDYPPNWIEKLAEKYREARKVCDGVFVTVPDYPDDYHPKALWVSGKTNIERTLDNIIYALSSFSEVNWLVPVQGHYRSPESVVYALELYQRHDVPLDNYIALANLCVEGRTAVIVETVKLVDAWLWRNGYYNTKIHVFGPTVKAMYKVRKMVYSFDGMAWTRPRTGGGWSCKNSAERVYLFLTWLYKYADLIYLPLLPKTMRGGENE